MAVRERVFMARVAEQGGSEDDMIEYIIDLFRKKDKQNVKVEGAAKPMPADYTKAERNLVHVGFKNIISAKRVIVRTLDAISENPKYTRYERRVKEYRKKI